MSGASIPKALDEIGVSEEFGTERDGVDASGCHGFDREFARLAVVRDILAAEATPQARIVDFRDIARTAHPYTLFVLQTRTFAAITKQREVTAARIARDLRLH